jgi:hypothetical protein
MWGMWKMKQAAAVKTLPHSTQEQGRNYQVLVVSNLP